MSVPSHQPTEYRQYRFAAPPGAVDIILVRHGESQPARPGVPEPRWRNHADPPLDPRGEREAERVARRLADEDVQALYVTPLRRTQQTAAPLAAKLGLEPLVEEDLREVHLGEWEGGVFRQKVAEGDPLVAELFAQQRWDVVPGAETSEALQARLRAAIERLAAAHPDQRIAVFAHGGVIATIAAMATGSQPFAFTLVDNGSLTHLVVQGERWVLRRFNDTGHLDTDLDRPPQPLT